MSKGTVNSVMEDKVSIIIPVYNGVKYLKKTVDRLLLQRYANFEIILVENNSKDTSADLCRTLQQQDSRIRAFSVTTKGTTLARKFGVLQAEGKYILFHDQDDRIMDPDAVSKMVQAIKEDNADICQFGYIKSLGGVFNKKTPETAKSKVQVFTRNEIMEYQIRGVLGFGWNPDIVLGTQVWNKIYKADLLKSAVENITESLYFCEDEYLNIFAFFNDLTQRVSVRQEYYYYWNVGVGFSSSDAARMTFLRDYQTIKKTSIPLIKTDSTERILLFAHWDSLTVYRWTIYSMLYDKTPDEQILDAITEIESYEYIQEAKKVLHNTDTQSLFKDVDFLTSDYSPEEYLQYCKHTLPVKNRKTILKENIKKIIVKTAGIVHR